MKLFPFQASYPRKSNISTQKFFNGEVQENYNRYKGDEYYRRCSKETFYIYQISGEDRTYTGLVGCISLEEYRNGRIIKHENTLEEKKQKHIELLLDRKAVITPVLLTLPTHKSLHSLMEEVIAEKEELISLNFEEEGQVHRLWSISDRDQIQSLTDLFDGEVSHCYIADGHHRLEASSEIHARKPPPFTLDCLNAAFFSYDQVEISDYNRILNIHQKMSARRFDILLSEVCTFKPLSRGRKPRQKHEMTLFLNNQWHRLKWKPSILQRYEGEDVCLDAHVFNEVVLQELMGIDDIRTNNRIDYIPGIKGVDGIEEKARGKGRVGFMLYPVQMDELTALADADRVLPPKSTWFEPRLKNGLIVQDL